MCFGVSVALTEDIIFNLGEMFIRVIKLEEDQDFYGGEAKFVA